MNELQTLFELINSKEPIKLEYRLYYNEDGAPLFKSGDQAPGDNYIVITKDQFDNVPTHYMRVHNGQLIIDDPAVVTSGRALRPVAIGTAVAQNHPAVIIEDTDTNFQLDYYGTNN